VWQKIKLGTKAKIESLSVDIVHGARKNY